MGNIVLNGKTFPDRRNGNGRLRLDVADWVKISITIFTTFAIITFGAGKLLTIVNNHTEVLAEQSKEIKEHTKSITQTQSEITNINNNLIYLRRKLDDVWGIRK